MASHPSHNKRKVFGRKLGRSLRQERTAVMETLFPKLEINQSKIKEDHSLDVHTLFPVPKDKYWFEIGFGNGEHLAGLIDRAPNHAFVGAEPFINGVSSLLKDIQHREFDNLRLHMDDAIMLASSLRANSLDGIYVLNPDPWPKKRHFKRRMIQQDHLNLFAHILKPEGQLIMATDVDDLAEWMTIQTIIHPSFEWQANSKYDWQDMPGNWIRTRYEEKGEKAGRKQSYLFFKKV